MFWYILEYVSCRSSSSTDQAFVTLATNDSYARGAMVLGKSLRNHNTSKKLVALIGPHVSDPCQWESPTSDATTFLINICFGGLVCSCFLHGELFWFRCKSLGVSWSGSSMKWGWWTSWTVATRHTLPWWRGLIWASPSLNSTAGRWRITPNVFLWMQTHWWGKYSAMKHSRCFHKYAWSCLFVYLRCSQT